MRIKKLSYKDSDWELNNLILDEVSLVVGKNAVGKTRTLRAIWNLMEIFTQKQELKPATSLKVVFENSEKEELSYSFNTSYDNKGQVEDEELRIGDKIVLSRNEKEERGIAHLFNFTTNKKDLVHPPRYNLLVHTNRDIKKYPFLEEIANWAKHSFGFEFGRLSPFSFHDNRLPFSINNIANFLFLIKENEKKRIINEFNSIGYEITDIYYDNRGIPGILVMDANINKVIPHTDLSQGMFRALILIIYFEFLISREEPVSFVIDDLCEGLDYARATKLGELLFEKALNNNIQLIATSNDSFLMEVVDLKYWNILKREGKIVTGINKQSHPTLFEDFKFTGLSNFDFFSSNFITSIQK